jgi:hypothetical protein
MPAGYADRMVGFTSASGDSAFGIAFKALFALVTDPAKNPLVAGTRRVSRAPSHAIACPGGNVPRRSGRVKDMAPAEKPEDALRRFLAPSGQAPAVVAGSGYPKLVGPDGSIMFGRPAAADLPQHPPEERGRPRDAVTGRSIPREDVPAARLVCACGGARPAAEQTVNGFPGGG